MSSPGSPPDPDLDDLPASGEALRRRYQRSAAAEAPSAATDARIRAVAWQAVGAVPAPRARTWLSRLRVPLSIAAVLVLTMTAMVSMLRDTGERSLPDPSLEAMRTPASAPAATVIADAGSAASTGAAERGRPVPGAREARPALSDETTARRETDPAMSRPKVVAEASGPMLDEQLAVRRQAAATASPGPAVAGAATDNRTEADAPDRQGPAANERARVQVADATSPAAPVPAPAGGVAGPAASPAGSSPSAAIASRHEQAAPAREPIEPLPPSAAAKAARLAPDAWLERIRRLWDAGARDAALEQVAAFRLAYPAFAVPKDFPVPVPPAAAPAP